MKLATFTTGQTAEIGLVRGDRLLSLTRAAPQLAPDMMALIAGWDALEAEVRRLDAAGETHLDLSEARLLAPVPHPRKILAIGLNYADHVAESGLPTPEHQLWFAKLPNTVNGPYDDVQIPLASDKVDYEVELVAVIGRPGRHIAAAAAPQHVFGYCVGNDVSVRDWQIQTPQWVLGKSFDGHGPIGPWITTADEIGDPHRLDIRCLVNGELRQDSNTRHLVFDVWQQIAHLSEAMTLEPGDLLFTGTPGGVGWAMQPQQVLKSGDRVRCEIAELGAIECRMVPEAAPAARRASNAA
ncbi:fumarylacetoacetate hydrolase family protein [Xanthobacter dioxanivorans]|uniref:Fumarylacetoacetate hydrolase family protein n=1 Tax=Xanthobacter dioxanivorans TaxID=2528964 RepID=A0A974PPW1_9HYPH|nr:fumarylacetoacetate hydrolase family protein [Xanthobacter dioxanivorans]QRG07281.1 fumarylacetoacetate hydrolase family protein [Xanthobacter dioxanivorans]